MSKPLSILCFFFGIVMTIMAFPEGFVAVITVLFCSLIVVFIIRRQSEENADFLIQLFVIALIARLAFGLVVHIFDLRSFFGGDSALYDLAGQRLVEIWFGYDVEYDAYTAEYLRQRLAGSPSGWGMFYVVGAIYSITGKNIFAAQSFCALIGAATVPMVYTCANRIFNNRRVSKISALLIALYPAFIIWSGQLLKDGLIIFLLVLAMTLVLRLQEKFRLLDVVVLGAALFGIITLRFYIFYMAALAIVGAFAIGTSNTKKAMIRRLGAVVIIGVGLTYFGVISNSGRDIEEYANLERIQTSRIDLATSAESGYGEDLDVSTTEGAIAALPIGLAYLLLAPFPWQMTNLRQAITLPEVLLWWASIPFLLNGLWFTLKHRLRSSIPILVFSLMLTLAYALFLGNVGTAYRQRTQIQVFLFMFIGVGWTLKKEQSENKRMLLKAKKQLAKVE